VILEALRPSPRFNSTLRRAITASLPNSSANQDTTRAAAYLTSMTAVSCDVLFAPVTCQSNRSVPMKPG
jgi:hypothetical protein